jgi:hypothetical protein
MTWPQELTAQQLELLAITDYGGGMDTPIGRLVRALAGILCEKEQANASAGDQPARGSPARQDRHDE